MKDRNRNVQRTGYDVTRQFKDGLYIGRELRVLTRVLRMDEDHYGIFEERMVWLRIRAFYPHLVEFEPLSDRTTCRPTARYADLLEWNGGKA